MSSRIIIDKADGNIVSATLDGNKLLPCPDTNHYAVTPGNVSRLLLSEIPVELHLSMSAVIKNGKIFNHPFFYCIHKLSDDSAELHYRYDIPVSSWRNPADAVLYFQVLRAVIVDLSNKSGFIDISKVIDKGTRLTLKFKQIVNAYTIEDMIKHADAVKVHIQEEIESWMASGILIRDEKP